MTPLPLKVTYRIYWTAGCPNSIEVELCQDVCDGHLSDEKDTPCSKN